MTCSGLASESLRPLASAGARAVAAGSRAAVGAALAALLIWGLGCAGADEGTSSASIAAEEPGPIHIHAVQVDPADPASVILATHTGLFRWARGDDRPQLVGTLRQDTMGFTVIGPERYLGSGHPDLRTDDPPLLGLISSTDGGRTWSPVSLRGEVDFHILRAAATRVVGLDSQTGSVFVSDDAGRRWVERTPPGELVDMVLNPADADHILASTTAGLVESRDAGRVWGPSAGTPGYLAWPQKDTVFRLGPDGQVGYSSDGGRTWELRGRIGGEPSAFTAVDASKLLATTHTGDLKESRDGGLSWETLAELE